PDGGIHQDHQATLRLDDGPSRRLGTSRAPGSVPPRARRRSYAAWRTRASRPKRTVAVSVVAPQAALPSLKSSSSTLKVFFIPPIMPQKYGYWNHTPATARGRRVPLTPARTWRDTSAA